MTKEEFALEMNEPIESVYWCVVCEGWSSTDEDGYPICLCA